MPDSSGPGRNNATNAIISSKQSGLRREIKSFIPRDSSWKTAVVLASNKSLKDFSSSSGMLSIRTSGLPSRANRALIISRAHLMIVSVRNPKKSNLTKPAYSTSFLSKCVTGCIPSESQ